MTRIHIAAPGQLEEDVVEVADADGLVVGRAPAAVAPGVDRALRAHPVPSASVSGNHAAVWTEGSKLVVRDLGSRNGTWLRLPTGTSVELPRIADVELRLAWGAGAGAVTRALEAPRYRDASDYGAGVAQAVQNWFSDHEVQVRVWADHTTTAPTGTVALRLANGEQLHVQLERTVTERFDELMSRVSRYVAEQNALMSAEESTREEGMILASPAIRQVHRRVVQAALEGLPRLLLLGPSGTGKERLAQAYHRHLARTGPLVAINCAALSRDRMVADLFGAEAGAYTGAQKTMTGAVERADGGTLFLDEVGEIPLEVQPMLLRFLDTGEYQRMGAIGVARTANVFVVAATNRDVRQMVRDGTFRVDLFFRLALEVVEVPSLRERFSDAIAYLAAQSLGDASAHEALQPAALDVLREHSWHGNFRELVNLVRRLPQPSGPASIDAETVRRSLATGAVSSLSPQPEPREPAGSDDWLDWLRASALAYVDSSDGRAPATWSDLMVFVEQYLKPYALAHMAEVAGAQALTDVSLAKVADAVKADRGTVTKQLRRFFETKPR
ncbi:MAG: sigma-54-dependent Fis family transcriptional regulator [Acidobacteriota bacterium]